MLAEKARLLRVLLCVQTIYRTPLAQRDDQAAFLSDRQELARRDHAALSLKPS